MKKLTALSLILILLVSLAGCGNTPSEPASDTANNSDQVDNTNETTKVKLKTYYEVIYEGELLDALNYFDDNYDDFDEESRNDYKNALKEELTKLGEKYKDFAEIEQQAPEFPVQGTIEYVDLFYPNVFDSEKYTFNINTLDDELKNKANELKEDKIFSLCKSYWATDGFITDTGFEAIVKKDVYDIIEDRLLDGEDDEIINVNSYTDYIGSMDSVFESEAGDPKVLVENTDKLDLFKDANKTTLYVPVKIIDESITEDVEETPAPTDNTSSKDTAKEETPENKVIRNYDGPGLDTLGQITYDYKYSEENSDINSKTNRSLAVFGTIYDVEIGTRETRMGFPESLQEYDELSNTVIDLIDCPFTDEGILWNLAYVSFYDKDLNYYRVSFAGEENNKFWSDCEIKEIELKDGGPTKVAFEFAEDAILSDIEGSDDSFSALFLVDNYSEYMTDDINFEVILLESDVWYFEEEERLDIIRLWVSSNMYDVEVEHSNYGEVIETFGIDGEPLNIFNKAKNIKAGTCLRCEGMLDADGESYKIKFKLEDGTEKTILITTDESDEAKLINGYLVRID